jgi:cysteinyl-tRNA synthetase
MLTLNGKKMSKSTGNNIYPNEIFNGGNDLLSKTYSPSVVRFFMLQAHYTSILDLSDSALLASEKGYMRLMDGLKRLDQVKPGSSNDFDFEAWEANCYKAMGDDFNTPILIAHLFDGIKFINQALDGKQSIKAETLEQFRALFHAFVFDVLGLLPPEQQQGQNDTLDGTIQLLIDLRNRARADRDFATSDQIRDKLVELGVQLKDGKEGTTYSIE